MVHLHARETVVPDNACVAPPRPFGAHRRKPSVLGTREPKIEKQTSLTDNELCTHRARPGPHAPLGPRLVLHRRALPRRKSSRGTFPAGPASQYAFLLPLTGALHSPGHRTPKRGRASPYPPPANDLPPTPLTKRLPHLPCSKCWARWQASPSPSPRLRRWLSHPTPRTGTVAGLTSSSPGGTRGHVPHAKRRPSSCVLQIPDLEPGLGP